MTSPHNQANAEQHEPASRFPFRLVRMDNATRDRYVLRVYSTFGAATKRANELNSGSQRYTYFVERR